MITNNPDRDWEKWASLDAYYAVLTRDQYKKENIDLAEFFDSGEAHMARILDVIRRVDPSFHPKTALDFGCGVGRLLLPLSREAEQVIGADVSPTMLENARQNLAQRGISNATLIRSDDELSAVPDGLDFVHAYIVFQHIPVKRGEKIFSSLLAKLSAGGMGAVHFPFLLYGARMRKLMIAALNRFDALNHLANILRHEPLSRPVMQYNHYSLDRLAKILFEQNCEIVSVEMLKDRPMNLTAILFFRKR